MSTLYELKAEFAQVLDMMEDEDVEMDVIVDTLESISCEIEDKAVGYAKIIKMIEGETKTIKEEEERLAKRRKSMENKITNLKNNLQTAMELIEKKEIKTPLFSFKIQKNPPSVVYDVDIKDFANIPEEFLIPQDPKINTAAIKERLTSGEVLEIAHLEQKESLRIR